MSDSLSFKFTMTEADFVKIKPINARNFGMYWFHWIVIVFVTVVAGFALFLIASTAESLHWGLKMALGLAVFVWLLHWWEYYVLPKRMARKMPAALIEQDVTFSDEGISRHSALGSSNADWTAYTKAQESGDYFLLYASNYLCFPFPKRSLADPRDIERLRDLIRAHVADFRGGKPGS